MIEWHRKESELSSWSGEDVIEAMGLNSLNPAIMPWFVMRSEVLETEQTYQITSYL